MITSHFRLLNVELYLAILYYTLWNLHQLCSYNSYCKVRTYLYLNQLTTGFGSSVKLSTGKKPPVDKHQDNQRVLFKFSYQSVCNWHRLLPTDSAGMLPSVLLYSFLKTNLQQLNFVLGFISSRLHTCRRNQALPHRSPALKLSMNQLQSKEVQWASFFAQLLFLYSSNLHHMHLQLSGVEVIYNFRHAAMILFCVQMCRNIQTINFPVFFLIIFFSVSLNQKQTSQPAGQVRLVV